MQVKAFPWPSKHVYTGGTLAGLLFIFVLVFAFQAPASSMVKAVVQEKELRLREYMRVLGLQQAAYWSSWFTTHFSMLLVTGVLCAVVGRCALTRFAPLLQRWVVGRDHIQQLRLFSSDCRTTPPEGAERQPGSAVLVAHAWPRQLLPCVFQRARDSLAPLHIREPVPGGLYPSGVSCLLSGIVLGEGLVSVHCGMAEGGTQNRSPPRGALGTGIRQHPQMLCAVPCV